ncbi:rhodanese-like domain-containing protein [Sphingobacterium sp. UBA5670]|uniref:rhodanese-like domain-containing protein n=1 Tax=Sphingobacterium sp. UBA5670 TaxID=1947502 RepID=UPI0025F368B7|nr:rhodanese-like domain-containing protein [Sphingobacterium sp. UBA5670]
MHRVFIMLLGGCFVLFNSQTRLHAESKTFHVETMQIASDSSQLTLKKFKKLRKQADVQVLDTRSGDIFLQGFVPKSINIGFKGPFDHFLGQVFPDKTQKFLLITDLEDKEAVIDHLLKLGYTHIVGVLEGGFATWKNSEIVDSLSNISAGEFMERSDQGHIVDVRTDKEFANGHIDNAMNIPLTDFANFGSTLKKDDARLYVHCQSGYRSAVAISILSAKGFKYLCNIQGGYKALQEEIKENQ